MTDAILIFGIHGLRGRHLVTVLATSNKQVIALTRASAAAIRPNIETISGRFERPEVITPLLGRTPARAHAASHSMPGRSSGEPVDEQAGNPRPKPYYAAGKAAAEYFTHAYTWQFHHAATILHPSNTDGPGQTLGNGLGIIQTTCERIQAHKPLPPRGDGKAKQDYLYINKINRLYPSILGRELPQYRRLYEVASGNKINLNKPLDAIHKVTGIHLRKHRETSCIIASNRITYDPTNVKISYGWKPSTELPHTLKQRWK